MKKIQLVAALAAAVGAPVVALGIGTSTASAAPGISVDPGTNGEHTFGIGDQSPTGAQAVAKPGNTSVAVSIFGASRADASQGGSTTFGEGNNVVTIGSTAVTGQHSAGNNVLVVGGGEARVNGQHDNVVVVAGVKTTVDKKSQNDTVVTVCGARVSGQADHVKVSPGGC